MRPDYDPLDDPPWAMQLVVRAEKADPPGHGAVCEAAAMAVARLLTDPRATGPEPEAPQAAEPAETAEPAAGEPDGERPGQWRAAIREWEARRIRKVTRRARGVRWPEAQAFPGVTVEHDGAEVRAFVPGPVADVPPPLARLQVAGLDLADDAPAGPPPEPPYAALALNPEVTITTGKAAAQCGHAAQLLLREASRPDLDAWTGGGLRVHLVRDVPWRRCVEHATIAVRDGGFTEVPPGTMTAIAWVVR
ncbi:hypothetical protein [Actinomadura xylanilytica]|uniref:hypothetical protein n=1 Tax=Actinomadura xylanilytica TaxID=887459 RepID=UPI00255B1360|nr:hypothetical protein [Actinomadura xylanilytica]MDL4771518.1 hypothetical protein [Actinomadura xylanilytica]